MFDPLVAVITFAVIFPAELPDKSMFASVVLGTRNKPALVWIGICGAFLCHVVIAVTAGQLITFLPDVAVTAVVALLFFAGATWMLLGNEEDEMDKGVAEANDLDGSASDAQESLTNNQLATSTKRSRSRIALGAFLVIFVSEWGDITQLATINLAARYGDPLAVGVGASLALCSIAFLGVYTGSRLVKHVPMAWVRRVSGLIMAALAIWSCVDLAQMSHVI